jgi:flavin reductase
MTDFTPRDSFLTAMRHAASGVAVIATAGPGGRFAVTVSAVTSVSADPPLLLACINRSSPVYAAILTNQVFSVNFLTDSQVHVAETFAGRPQSGAPFDFRCASWHDGHDAPLLTDAVSSFHCRLEQVHNAGTHAIFVGLSDHAASRDAAPLIYTGQSYGRPHQLLAT